VSHCTIWRRSPEKTSGPLALRRGAGAGCEICG
jgi:hypothetical protein